MQTVSTDELLFLSWVAGFFEGEGSVRIDRPRRGNWGALCVDVANTCQELVRPFQEHWGGRLSAHPSVGRRKAYWRWRVYSRQAEAFLVGILPFVRSDKVRERIVRGLEFQEQKQISPRGAEYATEQWAFYADMARLNRRGATAPAERRA